MAKRQTNSKSSTNAPTNEVNSTAAAPAMMGTIITHEDAVTLDEKLDTLAANAEEGLDAAQATLDRVLEAQQPTEVVPNAADVEATTTAALSEYEQWKVKLASVNRVLDAMIRGFWSALGIAALGAEVFALATGNQHVYPQDKLPFFFIANVLVLAALGMVLSTFTVGQRLFGAIGTWVADIMAKVPGRATAIITIVAFLAGLASLYFLSRIF